MQGASGAQRDAAVDVEDLRGDAAAIVAEEEAGRLADVLLRDVAAARRWFVQRLERNPEDAAVLENNGARFIEWVKQPGQYILPYECDPTFALEYQEREATTDAGD